MKKFIAFLIIAAAAWFVFSRYRNSTDARDAAKAFSEVVIRGKRDEARTLVVPELVDQIEELITTAQIDDLLRSAELQRTSYEVGPVHVADKVATMNLTQTSDWLTERGGRTAVTTLTVDEEFALLHVGNGWKVQRFVMKSKSTSTS